ncbi:MAG TPA: AsmA-like C-terminal region-containing protein, partial [Phycisphaerae bacterium]|nr:AsmA-like C-terminal region-containing protein [Phycisphaerae bacterium]
MRRVYAASAVVAVVLLALVLLFFLLRSRGGEDARGGLADWVGRQIVAIVNAHVVPEISFRQLTYTPPGRVELADAVLSAPDGTRVVELRRLAIELAEVPRLNHPIVIEKVQIDRGTLNLVADAETGGLRGLWPLVRGAAGSGPVGEGEGEGEGASVRLSDVLRLRRVELRDISIRYDPGDGKPVMELAGITTALNIAPQSEARDAAGEAAAGQEPGWYALSLRVERPGLMRLEADGRVNLDTLVAEVSAGLLRATVGDETLASLPPELQALLRRHEAQGELTLRFSGRIPLRDWKSGEAQADVELRDFVVATGDYRLPILELLATARLQERRIELESLKGVTLRGEVEARGSAVPQGESWAAEASWRVERLDLRALMRANRASAGLPPIAGRLSSRGEARGDLGALPGSLRGSGEASVRDGELMWVPGLAQLSEVMRIGLDFADMDLKDRADVEFRLSAQGVEVTRSELVSTFIAARGEGLVRYDGTLDMRVNAGPMEKLKSVLGGLGAQLGRLTDGLMAYRVTGPLNAPKV